MHTQQTPPPPLSEKIAQLLSPEKEYWQAIVKAVGGFQQVGLNGFFEIVQGGKESLTESATAIGKRIAGLDYHNPIKQYIIKRLIENITPLREVAKGAYGRQWYQQSEADIAPLVEVLRAIHAPMIHAVTQQCAQGLSDTEAMVFRAKLDREVGYAIAASKLDERGNPTVSAVIKKRILQIAVRTSGAKKNNATVAMDEGRNYAISADKLPDAGIDEKIFWETVSTKMPEGYKQVFTLAMEGYSHAEIGEKLGIEASTSRSQLTKANGWLREQPFLQELAEEYGISRPSSRSR